MFHIVIRYLVNVMTENAMSSLVSGALATAPVTDNLCI